MKKAGANYCAGVLDGLDLPFTWRFASAILSTGTKYGTAVTKYKMEAPYKNKTVWEMLPSVTSRGGEGKARRWPKYPLLYWSHYYFQLPYPLPHRGCKKADARVVAS